MNAWMFLSAKHVFILDDRPCFECFCSRTRKKGGINYLKKKRLHWGLGSSDGPFVGCTIKETWSSCYSASKVPRSTRKWALERATWQTSDRPSCHFLPRCSFPKSSAHPGPRSSPASPEWEEAWNQGSPSLERWLARHLETNKDGRESYINMFIHSLTHLYPGCLMRRYLWRWCCGDPWSSWGSWGTCGACWACAFSHRSSVLPEEVPGVGPPWTAPPDPDDLFRCPQSNRVR